MNKKPVRRYADKADSADKKSASSSNKRISELFTFIGRKFWEVSLTGFETVPSKRMQKI